MTQSTTCRKVMSLLALYIDEKLDFETKEFVKHHLEICPECNKKYIMLKELIFELRNAYKQLNNEHPYEEKKVQFNIKEHEKFQNNISAYFDNELQLDESLNMKKYMINSRVVRKVVYATEHITAFLQNRLFLELRIFLGLLFWL